MFEGDIAACFDDIDHTALMKRVRGRIADKRVLGLVRAFLQFRDSRAPYAISASRSSTHCG